MPKRLSCGPGDCPNGRSVECVRSCGIDAGRDTVKCALDRQRACQRNPEPVAMARFRDVPFVRSTATDRERSLAVLAPCAPVAQLDRAPDYESGGQRFESFRARHFHNKTIELNWEKFPFIRSHKARFIGATQGPTKYGAAGASAYVDLSPAFSAACSDLAGCSRRLPSCFDASLCELSLIGAHFQQHCKDFGHLSTESIGNRGEI